MMNDSQVRGRGKVVVKISVLPGSLRLADSLWKTYWSPLRYPVVQQCLLGAPG